MMKVPRAYTPKIISENNIKFRIPLYQRLFAWEKENIEKLLRDLKEHFAHAVRPYYLGIITQMDDAGIMTILDGQQRLTVLMLLGAVFRVLAKDKNWGHFLFTDQKNRTSTTLRIQFFARDKDQDCVLELAEGKLNNAKNNSAALAFGYKTIENFLKINFACPEERLLFSRNIFAHATLLVTTLDSCYLARPEYLNRYFELMNSTGKNLEKPQLLQAWLPIKESRDKKAQLFAIWKTCEKFNVRLDAASTEQIEPNLSFSQFLKTAESRKISDKPASSDRIKKIADLAAARKSLVSIHLDEARSIVNFSQFLLLCLDLFLDQPDMGKKPDLPETERFKTENLLKVFNYPWNCVIPEDKIGDFYAFMWHIRALMDYYVIRRGEESSFSLFFGKSRNVKNSNAWKWTPADPFCRLAQYQAMLDVSFQADRYYVWLKPFLAHLLAIHPFGRVDDQQPSAADLLAWLKNWDNERLKKDGSLKKLSNLAIYRYPYIEIYWFRRLDYYLWERSQEPLKILFKTDEQRNSQKEAVENFRIKFTNSVEHLQPQTQPRGSNKWDEDSLHKFGNLALISASANSSQSNKEVDEKFDMVRRHLRNSELQSLKLLAMYNAGDNRYWNKSCADLHEKQMIAMLLASFAEVPC